MMKAQQCKLIRIMRMWPLSIIIEANGQKLNVEAITHGLFFLFISKHRENGIIPRKFGFIFAE
jgi:hypothetical protein